jgi:hypothetical protein
MSKPVQDPDTKTEATSRRATLKRLGKYAAVSAPTVTVLLAGAAKPKVAVAASAPTPPPP